MPRLGFEAGLTADGVNSNYVIFPGFSTSFRPFHLTVTHYLCRSSYIFFLFKFTSSHSILLPRTSSSSFPVISSSSLSISIGCLFQSPFVHRSCRHSGVFSFLCHLVGTVEWIRHTACMITVVLCRYGGGSGKRRRKAECESRKLNPEAGFLSSLPMKHLNACTKKKQGCCRCCC